ncbi:ABC transporter ATP-binding protein [Coprothermobacter platensis]|uniref:ABC transporter ATP-binding protein n=1 Tax=Coprothermobacter platensis TaxID=108819 RepID=UPI0003789173|nr:ABC transporter ATP-binding protein [Coprothermobacter platensis]
MLELDSLFVRYGGITAVRGISVKIDDGDLAAIIGANGAGKSSTLNAIVGMVPVAEGKVFFDGQDVTRTPTHVKVRKGMVLVPEGRRIFPNLTVYENLQMAGYAVKDWKSELDFVFTLFPILNERFKQSAGTLSGGEQQMLAIARGIVAKPKVLLLDEPSLGLSPVLVQQIMGAIKQINQRGTTVLLVEQNAFAALRIASKAFVMELGEITLQGEPSQIAVNEHVRAAYLGA